MKVKKLLLLTASTGDCDCHKISFSRHAKRSTVSVEDVRVCARRSESLLDFITAQSEQLRAEKAADGATTEGDGARPRRKGKGKKN